MTTDVIDNSTVTESGSVNPVDQIAAMIAANRRNGQQPDGSQPPPAGQEEAKAESPEVAPVEGVQPEESAELNEESAAPEENESSDQAVNDFNFLEFAEQNPNVVLKIPNKEAEGGFVELTASKAAAILGQGSAIHENARKLKVERAEFDEYQANRRKELDGLQIGLELTVVPQLQQAAEELVTLQQYNLEWEKIRDAATDPSQRSQAEAAIRKNAELIQEKAGFIQTNRPKVEQFYQVRSQQVQQELEKARQNFSDAELKNKAVFGELREKLSKEWKGANNSLVPGVPNIDLVSSDEFLLSLIRDGLKFREGPKVRNAGGSPAAVSKTVAKAKTAPASEVTELQQKAQKGDKAAGRDLLALMIASNRKRQG